MKKNTLVRTSGVSMALLMLALVIQSCSSVRLITEYDEITDKTAHELQENVTDYFVKLERSIGSDEADYEHFVTQFDEIKVDLNTLEVRAAAFEKNRIVQEQVRELKNMVTNLEALHKIGFSTTEQLQPLKQPFNSAFVAIVKLQLALKRGDKKYEY